MGAYLISGGASGGFLLMLLAAASGFSDGMAKKSGSAWLNDSWVKWAKASGFLTAVALIKSIYDVWNDSSLNSVQKIFSIGINIITTIAMMQLSALIMSPGFLFGSGTFVLGALIATLAIASFFLTSMLIDWITQSTARIETTPEDRNDARRIC